MYNSHLSSSNALIGIVTGNLCYKSLLFSVFPNYALSIRDHHLSRALTLYHKIDDLKMQQGSDIYSLTYQMTYAISNTHHDSAFRHQDNEIEIHELYKAVAESLPASQVTPEQRTFSRNGYY